MAHKKTVSKSKKTGGRSSAPEASAAGGGAAQWATPPAEVPLISVRYSDEPLSFHHHFGHEGGPDTQVSFSTCFELPIFRDRSPERVEIISRGLAETIRAIVTDAKLETSDRKVLKKPTFLFGDPVTFATKEMYDGNYKWLREVNGRLLFLPNMERMYPLSYFQRASIPRLMDWDVVRDQGGVSAGKLTFHGVHTVGYSYQMITLRPGSVKKDYPLGETPQSANVFIRKFIAAKGDFPAQGFRTPGWVHSTTAGWWSRMVNFVLDELKVPVEGSGLGVPILATCYGIAQSNYGFYAMLELYNPDTCTFFTPVGELGFALHEMHEVSGLPFGELPYEEFIPGTEELTILRKACPGIYDTFWELMCHFHICSQTTGPRGGGVKQGSWADYLFQNLHDKDATVVRLSASTSEEVIARMGDTIITYTNEAMEDKFPACSEFESFHYQALAPISDMALFAGFLMLWLKRCVVPTKPAEALAAEVVYPAVLLAHGRPLNLLSAMVSCLQSGLRELATEFVAVKEVKSDGATTYETPSPRVPLPYTYLVAWFVLHCPTLMTSPAAGDASIPLVHRLDSSQWAGGYSVFFRQILSRADNYTVFRCFPHFEGGAYGASHQDTRGSNSFTTLSKGAFRWLLNIRPGYLIYRQGRKCFIEPYQPYRFARQFGYDQLYIGNPNPHLAVVGNLYDGARAWYYSVAGCTGAKFRLPYKVPNVFTSLGFCHWYYAASKIPDYRIYASCLKGIRKMYDSKRDAKKASRLRGFDEFLTSEQEAKGEKGSEAAAATEQRPKDVKARAEKKAGKRALTAEEAGQHEKRTRRKLVVDPPTSQAERGAKLMASAFRAESVIASAPRVHEEEAQESSVVGLSHQAGLRLTGPAVAGGDSSYHPPDEEGGDESEVGDAESAPVMAPGAQASAGGSPGAQALVEGSPGVQAAVEGSSGAQAAVERSPGAQAAVEGSPGVEKTGGSLSPSMFITVPEAATVSPTTGLLSRPVLVEGSEESQEKVCYATDEEESEQISWPRSPVRSPGKASAYVPIPSPGKRHYSRFLLYVFCISNGLPCVGSPVVEVTSALDQSGAVTDSPGRQMEITPLTTAPSLTQSAPLMISLRPTGVHGSIPAGTFSIIPSSPSTLGIAVSSAVSSPATSAAFTPASATLAAASSSSPIPSLSPVDVSPFLGTCVEHLERMMRMTVEAISAGRGNFESFRPILMSCLSSIELMGDAQCTKRCSESLSRLEEDLKTLQGLSYLDVGARIESTLADIRAQAMHRYEALQQTLRDKESEVASLKVQCGQWQDKLTSETSTVTDIRTSVATIEENIAVLQQELAQQKARLSQKETEVKDLVRRSVEAHQDYCREAQVLEAMKSEVAAHAPNEENLRREATALAKAAYERELAEVKSRLVSITLRGSSA